MKELDQAEIMVHVEEGRIEGSYIQAPRYVQPLGQNPFTNEVIGERQSYVIDIAPNTTNLPQQSQQIDHTEQTESEDSRYGTSICCGILALVILAWLYVYFSNYM